MQIKRIDKFITLIIVSVLLQACSETPKDNLELVLKENISVKSEAAKYLTKIYPVIVSSPTQELLALSNLKNPLSVVIIDYQGNLVNKVSRQGKGPREIMSARFFGFDNDHIVIDDKTQALIKKFNIENDTVETFKSPTSEGYTISSRRFNKCDRTWYTAINQYELGPTQSTEIIGVFNENFSLIKTFGGFDPYFNGTKSILQDPLLNVDCDNNIAFTTHAKLPFIQIYDLADGSLIKRIDIKPPSFNLSSGFMPMVRNMNDLRDFLINEQSVSTFIAHNDKFIILPFRNETFEFYESKDYTVRDHFIAVYSRKNFSFVGEVSIDGAPLGISKEGYLITLVDDNPNNFRIKLYDIKAK